MKKGGGEDMKKNINIRIDTDLLARFERALDQEGLSKTSFITHAIYDFVVRVEKK